MKPGDESSPRCNHCIVFAENKNADPLYIDNEAIEHYRNALTDFQQASPFDQDWGVLKEDRPVFYYHEQNSNTVGFFGQSPNFRIPYSPKANGHATSVLDFIPEYLTNSSIVDIAEAIFGFVRDNKQDKEKSKVVPVEFLLLTL